MLNFGSRGGIVKRDATARKCPSPRVSLTDRYAPTIEFASLTAWRIYEFHLDALRADDGTPIANPLLCYTLNHLLENTPIPPPPGREPPAENAGVD